MLRGDLKQRPLPCDRHAQRERVHQRGLRFGRRGEDRRERGQNEARAADGNDESYGLRHRCKACAQPHLRPSPNQGSRAVVLVSRRRELVKGKELFVPVLNALLNAVAAAQGRDGRIHGQTDSTVE
jgi:hypothetical protein